MKKLLSIILVTSLALSIATLAYAAAAKVSKAITAEDQFTTALKISTIGLVTVEDTSSISATISLQIKPDGSATWIDTGDTFTAEGTWAFDGTRDATFRVGVKTGNFTSGTATVYLIQQ